MTLDVNAVEVDPARTYDIVGMLNRGRGLLHRGMMAGSETAYKTLNRIGSNQVVYSRLKAFEGAITVAPADLDEVYASQEFPTFTCGPSLLPGYFRLLTTTKRLWDRLQNLSTGMGGRRERVKPNDFLTISIALPPVTEQRRIVDVMQAVDTQVIALEEETRRCGETVKRLRIDLLDGYDAQFALGEVAEVKLGRMLSKDRATGDNQAPYIRNANVQWDGLDLTDLKTMSFPAADRVKYDLKAGDILACEGGDPGRCVLLSEDLDGIFFQKAIHRIRASEVVAPDFLYEALVWAYDTGRTADLCTSTTIKHLTAEKYRTLRIPIPDTADQARISALLSDARSGFLASRAEIALLRVFRTTLLTALLSQEIEISESYDDLLEKVS
ncbi:type I restriction enzyme S subunit [Lentzea atacamensis]|uniref:Type I restriction enzyme S subunit n=1 Tax=Lentzea atacamensis TaxID=531938 RepID=A0A316HT89_9PSEU|nr:restriction endonuclease subunit S [Lentzea atacamensis]PWK84574.1 type I restriction enzyme S subunit [Lentzea atacamensis]